MDVMNLFDPRDENVAKYDTSKDVVPDENVSVQKAQEEPASLLTDHPPLEGEQGPGTSWAWMHVRSDLLGTEIILCHKGHFKDCQEQHPDAVIYAFPAESRELVGLGRENLKLVHAIKRETEGFLMPSDHPEVVALKSAHWMGLPAAWRGFGEVCVDELFDVKPNKKWKWTQACHLFHAQGDTEALHAFARRIGLRHAWFQNRRGFPHYDLNAERRRVALMRGATSVDKRYVAKLMKSLREAVDADQF